MTRGFVVQLELPDGSDPREFEDEIRGSLEDGGFDVQSVSVWESPGHSIEGALMTGHVPPPQTL